jgi:hypothetical protein
MHLLHFSLANRGKSRSPWPHHCLVARAHPEPVVWRTQEPQQLDQRQLVTLELHAAQPGRPQNAPVLQVGRGRGIAPLAANHQEQQQHRHTGHAEQLNFTELMPGSVLDGFECLAGQEWSNLEFGFWGGGVRMKSETGGGRRIS